MLLRAVEEKIFTPLGSDSPVKSNFQLICGTNRDLRADVREGLFREDLLARIHLWTFQLPGLAERREDIEPNLEYELTELAKRSGKRIRFNREASSRFLDFAMAPSSTWRGNFRDLNAAVTRMATLSREGRITVQEVEEEMERLQEQWGTAEEVQSPKLEELLGTEAMAGIDLFDRLQLESVLSICQSCSNLAEAGRQLFEVSREQRSSKNDSDRIRKYLSRFGIDWEQIQSQKSSSGVAVGAASGG